MYLTSTEYNEFTNIYNIPSIHSSYFYNTHNKSHDSIISNSSYDQSNICGSPSNTNMCSSPPSVHSYSFLNYNDYESFPRLGRRRSSALLIPYPSVLETIKEVDEYWNGIKKKKKKVSTKIISKIF
jgi:hypothetical protein